MRSNKVMAIALDAAEPSLIEKWIDEGFLKNLARLKSKGAYGRLASSADWLVGSTWPTFYTSTLPNKHGFYHYLQWVSSKMDYERPGPDWISAAPFWRSLDSQAKVIAVDIPLAFPPTPFNGIEIAGWAAHDRIYPIASYPADKINSVMKQRGKPLISDEVGGLQEISDLLKLKNELVSASDKEAELIISLMKNENWDLFLCCFASTHRAGHKFWTRHYDHNGSDSPGKFANVKGSYSDEQASEFGTSLKEIYKSCDDAIGKILNNISEDTTVIVYSLHGMGVNTTLADKILPQMINRILGETKKEPDADQSFLNKVRNLIPLDVRSKIRGFLPSRFQDKMTSYWRMGNIDWSSTKAFNLVADQQGYIRINLRGREREGIVDPQDFDQLCDKIIEGIKSFFDESTGESIVQSIEKTKILFAREKGFEHLPDILVKWKFKPAASYKKIISRLYGEVLWPAPGLNPDGRSGNHRPEGFLLASGKNINNITFPRKHIIDIAPTILDLLELPQPAAFDGKSVKEIIC